MSVEIQRFITNALLPGSVMKCLFPQPLDGWTAVEQITQEWDPPCELVAEMRRFLNVIITVHRFSLLVLFQKAIYATAYVKYHPAPSRPGLI